MSWEAWGDPPEDDPIICGMCDNPLGSSTDCQCCQEASRASKLQSELSSLKVTLAHRLRIMRSRKVYEDGKKENGISVEMLMAMSLLSGIPGILWPHEVEPRSLAEAEKALLTFENAHCMYSRQPGCNCLHDNKPHPAIHAESCPYRIRFASAYGMNSTAASGVQGTSVKASDGTQP
jgi:hypothetical protein